MIKKHEFFYAGEPKNTDLAGTLHKLTYLFIHFSGHALLCELLLIIQADM